MILRIFPNLLVAPFKDGTDFPFDICVLTLKYQINSWQAEIYFLLDHFRKKPPENCDLLMKICKTTKKNPRRHRRVIQRVFLVIRQSNSNSYSDTHASSKNQEKHRQSVRDNSRFTSIYYRYCQSIRLLEQLQPCDVTLNRSDIFDIRKNDRCFEILS